MAAVGRLLTRVSPWPPDTTSRRGDEVAAQRFVALAERTGGSFVLNLGAGVTGQHDRRRTTVDVDLRAPGSGASGRFVRADASALPFSSRCFDGVVAKDVLEHVVDVERCLNELARVTKAGARLVVVTPRAVPRAVWADPTHLRGFTERSLLTALRASGWAPIGKPRRLGAIPGADRLGLGLGHIETILRLPVIGHRFGTNWVIEATRSSP